MKEKTKKEYLRCTRKLLETKLWNINLIEGINTWAVPLIRYSGLFLKRTREELKKMNQRTRKLMTMYKALHSRDDIDRQYVSRKEYTTRHDWGMCRKFKFDHMNKWCMHNPASVLENDTHILQWHFDGQTDHLISARLPDPIIINNNKKRTCRIVDFTVPADHNKTEGK